MSKGGGTTYVPTFNSSNSSFSNTTKIPDWLTAASQTGLNAATGLLYSGTPNYTGELSPGLSSGQTQAGQLINESIGKFAPAFGQAQGYTDQATGRAQDITPETIRNGLAGIGGYMNPYIQNVVNSVQDLSRQNLDTSLKQTADQAIAARAFGGSRHGVQEGVATAQNNLNTNNLIANLLNSGYSDATKLLGADVQNNLAAQGANQANSQNWLARLLSAGNQTADIGTSARAANAADINNVLQFGNLQQTTQAGKDTAAYQNWLWQQQYPFQALGAYNQTVSNAPHDTTQSGTSSTTSTGYNPQQQQTSSPIMSALGLGMSGLSWLNGIGGIGAIPGLLGMGAGAGIR